LKKGSNDKLFAEFTENQFFDLNILLLIIKEKHMVVAPKPDNEAQRLQTLRDFGILDSAEEIEFDEIVALASKICESEISLISLIDESRQWFKAKVGLDAKETHRDLAFCAHAIHDDKIMEVQDTHEDQRFFDNPLVLDDPRIRFYAGMPLETQDGYRLGTLCVIDSKPKKLNEHQRFALQILANQVIKLMELRIRNFELQRSIETRNRLLSVIAHDVKGPLKSLGLLAGYMTEDDMGIEELTEVAVEIEKVAHRTGDLVENILNWAQNIDDRKGLKVELIDLIPLTDEIQELYAAMLARKKLTLKISLEVNAVFGDAEMIKFIFRNLIGNAIKFSENSEILVDTSSQDGEKWQLKINDQGLGMSPTQTKKLFNWEERYTSLGTENEKGSGIGLLLVKDFIERHQGQIAIQSELGKGTTITINFKNQ
jgi:signal transduction histidine kinase